MRVAYLAFSLFSAAFIVHLIWWRIRIPRRQTATLLTIFLGVLAAGIAAMQVLFRYEGLALFSFWPCVHVAIFHVAMTLAYAVSYSAVEERSPSMTILTQVADSRERGRTHDELDRNVRGAVTVEGRLAAMIRDQMVSEEQGLLRLTGKGRAWATVLSSWRALLKLEKGG